MPNYEFRKIDGIFLPSRSVSEDMARILVTIGAVSVAPVDKPFTLTSGAKSPVYVDMRRVISFHAERSLLIDAACAHLNGLIEQDIVDTIAGGETAGIPFAAWIAHQLEKPMIYVRKKSKSFGRKSMVEGHFPPDARTVLVEDMTTDGSSKTGFVRSIRSAGGVCRHCMVLFAYGISGTASHLREQGIELFALCTWQDLLNVGKADSTFDDKTIDVVQNYLKQRGEKIVGQGGYDSKDGNGVNS